MIEQQKMIYLSMKKNIISLVVLIMAFVSCTTQKHFSFNRGGATQNFYYTTIPFEWVRSKIIVPVEINGKTYRFILDTGATNLVSETLCRELNLPVLHKTLLGDISGKVDSAIIVNMDSIAFGNVLFRNIPAGVVKDSNPFFQCWGIDGFIGSNMLRNSAVRFSLRDKTITLTDNFKKLGIHQENSWEVKLSPNQSSPIINIALVNVNDSIGVTEDVLFDTGADDLYSLCLRSLELFSPQNIFTKMGASFGGNTYGLHGNVSDSLQYKLLVPLMLINNASFTNVTLTTMYGNNSLIGSKILEYGDVTLDYKNKFFNFEHFTRDETDVYEKSYPIEITYKNNQVLVGFVWDEDLKEIISVGDRILFIDEEDYRNKKMCEMYTSSFQSYGKDKINVTLQKPDGSIHKIEIEKK